MAIEESLKAYDSKLFIKKEEESGKQRIMRASDSGAINQVMTVPDIPEQKVMEKLREADLWQHKDTSAFLRNLDADNAKAEESKRNSRIYEMEEKVKDRILPLSQKTFAFPNNPLGRKS